MYLGAVKKLIQLNLRDIPRKLLYVKHKEKDIDMSATLHKVIYHVAHVIKHHLVCIGYLHGKQKKTRIIYLTKSTIAGKLREAMLKYIYSICCCCHLSYKR